jgi:hypothetical protein
MFAVEHGKVQTENKAREGKKGGWGLLLGAKGTQGVCVDVERRAREAHSSDNDDKRWWF